MNKTTNKIDFAKLLGFDAVSDQIAGVVDFQDETIGAKLGAKVGDPGEPIREPAARAETLVKSD
jgi:hypothetical protein